MVMATEAEEGLSATDPKTYKQAMKQVDKKSWQDASNLEVESLKENKVHSVVDMPKNKPIIPSKWVFKKKRGVSGKVEKHKARVVAKGYMQEEGLNFFYT